VRLRSTVAVVIAALAACVDHVAAPTMRCEPSDAYSAAIAIPRCLDWFVAPTSPRSSIGRSPTSSGY
jgi:hypothetical protein